MRFLLSIIDFLFLLVPRFVNETVAVCVYEDESWEILGYEEDLEEGEQYSFLAQYSAFTFLGQDYFAKIK